MGQTLTNGIYLPDEGERNAYSGLEANWRTLDALILTVNGKAAPNVANTWTAAQTFTAGIAGDLTGDVTGNLTGTATRATADEDGTNIKTGYVKCTTNQSIGGQKTFYDNTFFTTNVYHRYTSYESGNIPASNLVSNIYLADKNNIYMGYLRNIIYTSGRTATEIRAKNTFKNGVLDPTGADISSNFKVEVQPNGTKTIYWDSLIRNDLTPFTTNNNSLGTSSNKWKTLNGINPGALSLPDVSKSVTVDTTNYTWTDSDNTYVAPADGWLSLKTTTGLSGRLEGTTTGIGSIVERSAGGRLVLLHIPVLKNESVTVSGVGSDFILKFYPCLGNV